MLMLKAEAMSSLNDFYRINLNEIRRAGVHDDGVFNECKLSDQEFGDEIASININSKDNDNDDDDYYYNNSLATTTTMMMMMMMMMMMIKY